MNIITGMHRSGTSLVTRFFFEMGADLGDPEGFIDPDRWNRDGYFEQKAVLDINRALIHGPIGKLAYLKLPSIETIRRRGGRHAGAIRKVASDYQGRLVKETRFSLTLPAWIDHGAAVERIIVCLRHPSAVARSLARRNLLWRAHGYRLWTIHNERLLRYVEGMPVRFVSYAHVVRPETFTSEMEGALTFMGVGKDVHRLYELSQRILRPSPNDCDLSDDALPEPTRDLWRHLVKLHAMQHDFARDQ